MALYRVSTAEQGPSGLGLDAQKAAVRAFVATQGWTLVAECSDRQRQGRPAPGLPGRPHAVPPTRGGAGGGAARPDHAACPHTLSQLLEDGYSIRAAATVARGVAAERAAHRLLVEVEGLRGEGVTSRQGLARALTERGVPTPRDGKFWTHTTVGRLLARVGAGPAAERFFGD